MSKVKGTGKTECHQAMLVRGHGLEGDAHAGEWHRQVSLLPLERIEEFRRAGATVALGDFGENLVVAGLDWATLRIGSRLRCGEAVLELTQFGKQCHDRCHIFATMGDCIMPRHGIFAIVLQGGKVRTGDTILPLAPYQVALLTVSDKASGGERYDASGETMQALVEAKGMEVVTREIVPDVQDVIAAKLKQYCDSGVSLVLTSGGTGFSRRDVTPEATLQVVERLCPGIPEAMRTLSLAVSKRAMLSRAVAGICGSTLMVNLPGSPKAVGECLEFVLEELVHGLEVLAGDSRECGS